MSIVCMYCFVSIAEDNKWVLDKEEGGLYCKIDSGVLLVKTDSPKRVITIVMHILQPFMVIF